MGFMLKKSKLQHLGFVFMATGVVGLFLVNAVQLDMSSHLLYGVFGGFLGLLLLVGPLYPWKLRIPDLLLLAFLLATLPSFYFREQPFGFQELTTFFVGTLVYFLARFWDMPQWPLRKGFILFATAASALALVEFVTGPSDRLAGFFHGMEPYAFYPNAMALFLLAAIPMNAVAYLSSKKKFWLFLLLLINLTAFWLTFSRGSALSLGATAFLGLSLAAWRFGIKNLLKPMLTFLFATALSMALAFGLNELKPIQIDPVQRFQSEDVSSLQSVGERFEFWKGAVEMTLDKPFTGVGPGGFEAIYPNYQDHWLVLSSHPHNIFLKLSSESGGIAMGLFALFLISLAWISLRAFSRRLWRDREWAFFLVITAFLAHNFIDYNLNFVFLSALFFLSLGGLLRGLQAQEEPFLLQEGHPKWPLRLMLFFLGGGLTVLSFAQGLQMAQLNDISRLGLDERRPEEALSLLESFPILPFEWNRVALQAKLHLELEDEQGLKEFLQAYLRHYPRWSEPIYFLSKVNPEFTSDLIQKNPYNSLQYYSLYFSQGGGSWEEAESILKIYTQLLSLNMHQTVLSKNPNHAEQIFFFFDQEDSILYRKFLKTWENETLKFDRRFHTTLHYEFTRRHEEPWKIQ